MKNSKLLVIAAAATLALSSSGCSKKSKPKGPEDSSGVTGGDVQPDPTTSIADRDEPLEPAPGKVSSTDLEGPLKNVYFDFDRSEIRTDQRPTMEANASWLAANSTERVLIEGHCDERGTEEYNLALGDRRANSARAYLTSLGVAGSRLSTLSYGKTRPVDPGHDENAWWKNRRAEFKVGGMAMR